jgi:hypothetical protein
MIDITGPKVLTPALLFAVLSPGMLLALPAGGSLLTKAVTHAVVLAVLYYVLAKFLLKVNLTSADLVMPALLFVMLTPGVLLTIPPGSGGLLMSGQGGPLAVGVHTLVFAVIFATLRSTFPQVY